MLEQGSPFVDSSTSILVAAGPEDAQAIALVQSMRQAGLRVTFAQTVTIAARASEATACVVLLRPDTWKAQTIATVMRAKPTCLIPVLAEPMELPRGPWTHEAVSLGDQPEQGQQEVIQLLRGYLATRPTPTSRKNSEPLTLAPIHKFKKRRHVNMRPFFTALLILLIVGLGGALVYRYSSQQPAKSQATNTSNTIPITAQYRSYTAKKPGDLCDTGNGQWEQANRYKKDKKTEVYDPYISTQCQSDGLLIKRSGAYNVYSDVFFEGMGISPTIAQHSFVQVDATVVSGDAQADMSIDVHIQNNSYGRYGFDVNTLGRWEANVGSTVDGSSINRLSIGFFPKASKTYTLAVETNGPVMSFWINGTKVTTVTDTTYTDNDSIAIGVSDYTANEPISALFSNFQYKELAPGTLTTPQLAATATAQAQSSLQAPYSAHIPGYDCNKGAGQWQPALSLDWDKATLQCLPGGMQLTEPGTTNIIGEEDFYWLNGHFPQNYKVSAHIDVSQANTRCAGLETRMTDDSESPGSYAFIICPDGGWEIALVTDTFQTLAHGWVNAQNAYQITAVSDGSNQSLFINGQLIKTVSDSHLKSTDHLSLSVGLYAGKQAASATFSDFVFTPLP